VFYENLSVSLGVILGDKEMGKLHHLQNKKSKLKNVKCIKLGGNRDWSVEINGKLKISMNNHFVTDHDILQKSTHY